jgi:dihydroflavonol-4-reductase
MRRVFIAGGTGFLGYHAIQEFVAKGWEVTALGLPPAPPDGFYPPAVKVVIQSIDSAADEELLALLKGHDALVFAAGLDDRNIPPKPSYPKYYHANVEAPLRLFSLAVQAGIKRAVVLGSYFAYFNRIWPEMKLAERHPYIHSRLEQEKALTSVPGLDACVLELPYIFGVFPAPGWKPLWTPLVRYVRSMKTLFYMKGGTTCISARVVGRAILAAVERGKAGEFYPIGQENLAWPQMLSRLAAADGRQVRRVLILPTWLIHVAMQGVLLSHNLKGREGGLNLRYFAPLQTAETYIDPQLSQKALGYELDNLDESFRETVAACQPVNK